MTPSGSEYTNNGHDHFIISCARGETVTLGYEFSETISASVSGAYYTLEDELSNSKTITISASKTYSGPSQSSSYNSIEYRTRFYVRKYNYTQTRYIDGYASGSKSGSVIKPVRYASYSIYRNIS